MPLAKIHVLESRYDEQRLSALSRSVQEALIAVSRSKSSANKRRWTR